ncbi:hypothetical protein RRG08_050697 [Elysia crispata]|uniref:Uncharacterized protein n=1 Tax=Elysia crispata TaxID=231223 RepID=A0AAE1A5P1_9GAST|nr:hypothetical protein RRG08_050697 [Elysia crispata]
MEGPGYQHNRHGTEDKESWRDLVTNTTATVLRTKSHGGTWSPTPPPRVMEGPGHQHNRHGIEYKESWRDHGTP